LGFFKTRKEAEEASLALAKEAGLPGSPWLVQPTVGEYNKYYRQALSNLWAVNISSAPVKEDSAKVWTALTGDKAQRALKKLGSSDQPVRLYRSETTVNGQRQYRIRLGFFATQEEAVKAGQTLATAAGLTASQIGEPWAAHPTKEEEEANK
jgi:ABC-type glycerol-3-phosphate transport system substrate-binding protein